MIWFILFSVLFFALFLFWFFVVRKYRNPYKLIMIFGKKGCGKSTTLVKLALKYYKAGWTVFSTEPVPYAFEIHPSEIGYVELPEHSVLLIDEVGMIYDNRNFKQFKPEVRDFFKLQRHHKIRCYLFSQSFDIDKKLRDLTDEMYLLRNLLNVFSYGKRIHKSIVLTKSSSEAPSTISEDLVFDHFLMFWAGSRTITYIPKYSKYFDSFKKSDLFRKEFSRYEIEIPVKNRRPRFRIFRRRSRK